MVTKNTHTHRYIARFVLEAATPLFVGSGDASLMTDALVQKDVNGFPMIPGTALAGVLRHTFKDNTNNLFGASHSENNGNASKLKVSSAYMLLLHRKVSEGILDNINVLKAKEIINAENEIEVSLLEKFENLPTRQHVRITHKGAAEKGGLFDNEVVYKGTRFIFELEVRGTEQDKDDWERVLDLVHAPTFRIGSGTRNGYGLLQVVEAKQKVFNLENQDDFEAYLNFNPSLNIINSLENYSHKEEIQKTYTRYELQLEPDSFFIFSAGFGDEDADNKALEEEVIFYTKNGEIKFEKQVLIPASSIKGAIAHRVAFHYNKLLGNFADGKSKEELELLTGGKNPAVHSLFGNAGGKDEAKAGNVFINDFYYSKEQTAEKIFNHVAIDRFTGGAMQGALFSEKVTNLVDGKFEFNLWVNKKSELDSNYINAIENTLLDICNGLLPLGGMSTKGHGIFTGIVKVNGEELMNYHTQQ
jgi:CRISPR/Cas system CSM-associated protein Csm3 (group 7 of RAMP superfamily)